MTHGKLKWTPELQKRLDALLQMEIAAAVQVQNSTGIAPDWNVVAQIAAGRLQDEQRKAQYAKREPKVHWAFKPRPYQK